VPALGIALGEAGARSHIQRLKIIPVYRCERRLVGVSEEGFDELEEIIVKWFDF
jgi:hypothetical protein